jgi:ribosome-binding ATPase YchF (GTP1/OBG family)
LKKHQNILNKYVEGTGIQNILNSCVFNLLNYIPIYPGGLKKLEDSNGNVLPDCFLMHKGSTAIDFAYRLHSDIGDGFIKAINVKTKFTFILQPIFCSFRFTKLSVFLC